MQKTSVNWPERLLLPAMIVFMMLIFSTYPLILLLHLPGLYQSEFREYNSYNNFQGYNEQTINSQFDGVLDYLNFSRQEPDQNYFSAEDLIHLSDVRNLIKAVYILAIISGTAIFLLILGPVTWTGLLRRSLRLAGLATLGLVLIIVVAASLNFHALFISFHELSFSNPYWQLDPATSNLIKYFPEQIFANLLSIWLGITALCALFCVISAKIIRREAKQ
jgi:integral membrane protein (TIGR01906 family)